MALASNNPFRNKSGPSATPGLAVPLTAEGQSKAVPATSTNPFLDSTEIGVATTALDDLHINDSKVQSPRNGPPPPTNGADGGRRPENIPPKTYAGRMIPPGHRPSQSEEDRRRHDHSDSRPKKPTGELNIFADPPDSSRPARERRPARRNSESSVREKIDADPDPNPDKRKRERRRRDGRRDGMAPKPHSRRLDIIDKLDVTSIYGTGLFHHDGPFDACAPSRNRKNSKQAPMQAFPKDSRNMLIGGSGPVNKKLNLDQIHGTGQEAHIDYNEAAIIDEDAEYLRRPNPERSASFNPTARVEPLHGEETIGLGTSTFLEGAPASRAAMQRRESEFDEVQAGNSTHALSRKKSLVQKFRSVRQGGTSGRMTTSPEPVISPTSPLATSKSETTTNPFFKDHDKDDDRKGTAAQISFVSEERKASRARAPSSPQRLRLERSKTTDSIGGEEAKTGGFLSRVKSLKGRKGRTERRDAS